MMKTWRALLACLPLTLGCPGAPEPAPIRTEPGMALAAASPAAASSAASPAERAVPTSELEEFAGIRLPADAHGVSVAVEETAAGGRIYRARLGTSTANARALCSAHGLGGPLVQSAPLDAKTRARFRIPEAVTKASFGCKASHPETPRVQRQVLVVAQPGDVANMYLIAFEMPAR
jgi:hypothetical protein